MGKIAFEGERGGPDYVSADQLAPLLREVAVPVVVLNACRSAMLDADAESAFASLAAALLQSGTRSAVAMGYNLYVSAAEVLFPPSYRRLFESGSVPEAVRAGRQALLAQPKRLSVRWRFPLTHDWLVPVLYQHEDFALAFRAEPAAAEPRAAPAPPVFGLEGEAPLRTFVGRDGALLQLERALRRRPAGILLHGLGGVGKTTLARGLLDWLAATDGLAGGAFWFSFQEIKSADYVWNRLGERLFRPPFSADVPRPEKPARLAAALHQAPLLIVWDNFEVVAGLPGEAGAFGRRPRRVPGLLDRPLRRRHQGGDHQSRRGALAVAAQVQQDRRVARAHLEQREVDIEPARMPRSFTPASPQRGRGPTPTGVIGNFLSEIFLSGATLQVSR